MDGRVEVSVTTTKTMSIRHQIESDSDIRGTLDPGTHKRSSDRHYEPCNVQYIHYKQLTYLLKCLLEQKAQKKRD